jgi:hypothetical protein
MVSLLTEGGGIVTPDVDDPQSAEHGPDSDGETWTGSYRKLAVGKMIYRLMINDWLMMVNDG